MDNSLGLNNSSLQSRTTIIFCFEMTKNNNMIDELSTFALAITNLKYQ